MDNENIFGNIPNKEAFQILAGMVKACNEYLEISRQKEEIYKEMAETYKQMEEVIDRGCENILKALHEDLAQMRSQKPKNKWERFWNCIKGGKYNG